MMRRMLSGVCAVLAGLLLMPEVAPGAEVPRGVQEAFEHYMALPEVLVPVLAAAQDAASAEKAAPDLQQLLTKVYDARREINAIPELAPEVAEEVRRRYEQKMRHSWGLVYEQIYRLQRVRCYENVPFFKQFRTLCVLLGQ